MTQQDRDRLTRAVDVLCDELEQDPRSLEEIYVPRIGEVMTDEGNIPLERRSLPTNRA